MPSIRIGTTLSRATAPTMPHMMLFLRFLPRALVARLGCLRLLVEREDAGLDVAPHGRAGAYRRAAANRDRGHQLRIGPDVDVVLDHRPMLVRAVVVAGDRARTDVDVAPDRRVAHVGQVVRLAALADGARLHLDEVADVNLVRQTRAWPDARVRADPATRPDVGA